MIHPLKHRIQGVQCIPRAVLPSAQPALDMFITLQRNLLVVTPQSLQCYESSNLFSVFIDYPILDILYKWNYIISGLLCLASFLSTVFPRFIHVITCIITSFLSIFLDNMPVDRYLLFIYSLTDGHLGYFHFWPL